MRRVARVLAFAGFLDRSQAHVGSAHPAAGDIRLQVLDMNGQFSNWSTTAKQAFCDGLTVFTGRPFLDNQLVDDEMYVPERSIAQAEGRFCQLDLSPDGLNLSSDLIGCDCPYYCLHDSRMYFASHLGLLVDSLPTVPSLNRLGVASRLFAQCELFEQTHFQGVFRVPTDRSLTVSSDGEGKLQLSFARASDVDELLTRDARRFTADNLEQMLRESIGREPAAERSVLMLSRGRDSLALALTGGERMAEAFTYGERYAADYRGARKRAAQLKMKFRGVPYAHWGLDSYASHIVGLFGGAVGLEATHNEVGYAHAARLGADVAFAGFLGDAVTGAHLGATARPSEEEAVAVLAPNLAAPIAGQYFSSEREEIRARIVSRFRELVQRMAPHQALMWLDLTWRQGRRIGLMFDLNALHLPVATPFFSNELIVSALQASPEALCQQSAYDAMLCEACRRRGVPENLWDSFWVRLAGRLRRALAGERGGLPRVSWMNAVRRSRIDPESFASAHDDLDAVIRTSWRTARTSRPARPPEFCFAAPIAAKARGDWPARELDDLTRLG